MTRIVRLTEADLVRLVRRTIKEDEISEPNMSDYGFDTEPWDESKFQDNDYVMSKHNKNMDWLKSDEGKKWKSLADKYSEQEHRKQKIKDEERKKETLKKRMEFLNRPDRRRNMEESEEEGEERSDEEIKKLADYFWNSMTTGEKRRFMSKIEKERKEKGLPSLRPKSSRIMKKDK
jgi:hypothetical protein